MNIKGFKRMLFGEKMPDKDDPQYKERYEREVQAGHKFAKATRIDQAAAKVQGFANAHRTLFLVIVFTFVIGAFAWNAYRLVTVYRHSPTSRTATEMQDSVLRERHKLLQEVEIREQKTEGTNHSKRMLMNTRFEKSVRSSDEWYTPKEILDALGKFDLDPCAPIRPLWPTAEVMYDQNIDGLSQIWEGRVWLNPPYSRPLIELFVRKLAEHGNGIALLFNRCDSKMFQDVIFPKATGMKFLRHRIRFYRPDGTRGDSPGCGSLLLAFGEDNAEILRNCAIEGKYVQLN